MPTNVKELLKHSNYVRTTMTEALTAIETDMDVIATTGFPTITGSEFFKLTLVRASDLAREIIHVTAVAGLTLTIVRAREGTTGITFADGDRVEQWMTSGMLETKYDELKAVIDLVQFANPAATDQGDNTEALTIAKLTTDTAPLTVELSPGTYTVSTDYTVPNNITLKFARGAVISVDSGKTLTIQGHIDAPLQSIFTGAGTFAGISLRSRIVYPEWFGAEADGIVDCRTAISKADGFNSESVLLFSGGIYLINSSLTITNTIRFESGGLLNPANATTLTIDGAIEAETIKIFGNIANATYAGTPRNVEINPVWFGAVGNSASVDDQAGIQKAIDFTPLRGVVKFPRDRIFYIGSSLTIATNGRTLKDANIRARATTTSHAIVITADNTTIEGGFIDMQDSTSAEASGIKVSGADITISDSTFIEARSTAYGALNRHACIYGLNCSRLIIESCRTKDSDSDGIVLEGCSDSKVIGCVSLSDGNAGISVYGGSGNMISNNNIVTPGDEGIIIDSAANCIAEGNTISLRTESTAGILLNIVTETLISGNNMTAPASAGSGINLTGACVDITMVGNHIGGWTGSGGDAITVSATSSDIVVTGNNLRDNTADLTVTAGATSVIKSGNLGTAIVPVEDYILIRDVKADATDAGTFTSGAWQTRDLNEETEDTGGHSSIGSNQITLAAGTYRCWIVCPSKGVNTHQARLQNVDDATTISEGTSERTSVGSTSSIIIARFTLAASKVLEVQHRCETTVATFGFGQAANFTADNEIYTVAQFWKEDV